MTISDQTDQYHQIPQNISDAISEKLASVVKKNLPYKLEDFYLDSFGSDSTTLRNQLSMVCLTDLREIFVCRKTGGYQWIGK